MANAKAKKLVAEGATLELCAQVGELRAAEDTGEGSSGSPKRFEMVAYTGGAMRLFMFDRPVVVDLAGLNVTDRSRPILRDHDTSLIAGHTDEVRAEGSDLIVGGLISGSNETAREIVDSAAAGFPWRASIGAAVRSVERVEDGETVNVNGMDFEGPLDVVRRSELGEVSFVALGADDATSAKIAAMNARDGGGSIKGDSKMDAKFKAWLEARDEAVDQLSDERVAELRAEYDKGDAKADPEAKPDNKPESKPVQAADADQNLRAFREAQAAETRRVAAIRAACAGGFHEIEAKAISEGWSEDKTRLEVMQAKLPTIDGVRGSDTRSSGRALEAAMCMSAGMSEDKAAEQYDAQAMDAATSREMRGAGIHSLIYETIAATGGSARPGRVDDSTIRAAFEADRQIQASGGGGFSTISLTGILSNVANRTLLESFEAVPRVSQSIAAEIDVNDFKEVDMLRLTGSGTFEKVGADGELKSTQLTEEKFGNKLETYGRMISLTRQMIVNDDLGAFLQIPRLIGRMSALQLESEVFSKLLENPNSFFSAGNKNFISGADTELGIDSLTAAEQKFLDQVDQSGNPILLTPSVLLVPTSLKVKAQQLFRETAVDVTTTANKPQIASNPHAGKFTPLASPYLNAQSLSGSSAKAWYLMSNPQDVAALSIVFLRGRRTPTIESADTNFNTLGVDWRGFFDFGVREHDPRAAVKAKGEA